MSNNANRSSRVLLVAMGVALAMPAAGWAGRFLDVTMDGSLAEWQAGDRLYDDSEITDGVPDASTYSDVYVANDADNLYIGLKLKGNSSIFSDWTHSLYLDIDGDGGTGFNSGWMSGGYDRLVQYGGGGGVYSVYSFTGGDAQSAWAWNYEGAIGYAYNDDVIEWSIPRSALGGATMARLQFLTEGGSVGVQTWAYQFEAGAKTYSFAATPHYTVTVASARGTPSPAVGAHVYSYGTVVDPDVISPAAANGTQYVSLGWTLTGHSPASGGGTNFTMTVTNHAALTWLWQTNVQVTLSANGPGSIGGDAADYYARGTTVNLTATPDAGYVFKGWSGDVPAGQTNDNPLALTLDRRRNVTANFGAFPGAFTVKTLDGGLGEWSGGELFYTDAEIVDGEPLNSTYSAVYVGNDHQYVYVGLQLKGNSSIFSNWTHNLLIDTDLNPATGYNAGWMGGGYDRLVQYGGGGGSYSIFTFSGAGQAEWSWSFTAEIGYAFNNDVIEWAIPRSALGGSTAARLQFLTEGGSVTVLTWAHHTEAQARIYAFGATPQYTVTVASARGTPSPAVGAHAYSYGTVVDPGVISPAAANGTQYVSLGWTLTGHAPSSGGGTNFTMTVTNSAALTWLWQTNVQVTLSANGPGSIGGDAADYYARGTTLNLTATPDAGYVFKGWSGDVPAGQTNDNPLALTLDRRRNVTANFGAFPGAFSVKTLDGVLFDWSEADVFYVDAEIVDGVPLNSTYSSISVANDHQYLYVGMQLKAPSSILSNWLHTLYIDSDLNPATGFNSGWMGGGYDRMVQYGGGGGTYSIYSFAGAGQAEWAWDFVEVIGYAFNEDVIEWAIPRTALGGSTAAKLQFHTGGGAVTIETWAHHTEAQARIYAFGATPHYTVTVASARGTPSPAVGSHVYSHGTVVDPSVISPTAANGTQYVSLGWTLTGHVPSSGGGTNFTMTVTNSAALAWLWQTNVQFTRAAGLGGGVSGDGSGYYPIGSTVNLTATPEAGYTFHQWNGAVPAGQVSDNPLSLTLDRTRSITASFHRDVGRFTSITLDGSLGDWQAGDEFYSDADIIDGEPLNSTYSAVYVANDSQYLYVGLQLKAPSSILSNWMHSLYIDTDLNPATGFNAGWMSGGYDRLVQYGGGGGTYSIYTFTGSGQAEWSWAFTDTIGYAYNGDVIEWAIPRSALGGGTEVRLTFLTEGGSVTVATWAYHTEAQSRTYAFATPDGCVPGLAPRINPVGNQTVLLGDTLSFTVTAHDPSCVAPLLTITGKPSAASFTPSVSSTNRLGAFSWTPGGGDVGTHLVRFIAADDEGNTTSRLIRIYVGNTGEPTNSAGVPHSQTNWAVEIASLADGGGNGVVEWSATEGIPYDLYYSDSDPSGAMTWVFHARVLATDSEMFHAMPEDDRRYFSVVPAGETPDGNGIWGVIKPTLPGGYSMYSAPLDLDDLTVQGAFGDALKDGLANGSQLLFLEPGGNWTIITLAGGNWDQPYTVAEGQGFFVVNAGAPYAPRFAGPVGNSGGATLDINPAASPTAGRWNIIGLQQGRNRGFAQIFATGNFTGTPTANWNQNFADMIAIDIGGGVFQRAFRAGDGTWRLASNPGASPAWTLTPGAAVYYFRYGDGPLSIDF